VSDSILWTKSRIANHQPVRRGRMGLVKGANYGFNGVEQSLHAKLGVRATGLDW
jgi:hypothetical protein